MANKRTITFDLLAKNSTGKGFKDAGRDAQSLGRTMSAAGAAAAAGFAVAGAAAVAFGISSVKAFAEAQAAQERLNFAYSKFPAIADVTRESYDRLNKALQNTTGFDDDLIASSQGVLAQFGLTGTQIQRLTPLLLDYARAQGKDLTTSAEDLGRALLGQGRALKTLGLDFDDAGSVAANYDQLVAGLTTNVAGYAETFGTTAAGKFEILTVKWGDFQEQVGEALLPGLEKLMEFADSDILPRLTGFAEWFGTEGVVYLADFVDEIARMADDGTLVPNIVAGIGAITAAQIGLNAAMAANPVGIIIAAIVGLGAWFIWLGSNFETAQGWVLDAAGNVTIALAQFQISMNNMTMGFVNSIINMINGLMGPINAVRAALGLPPQTIPAFRIDNSGLQSTINQTLTGIVSARNPGGGGGAFRAMAEGGIVSATPGGMPAVIGEGAHDELVLPLTARNLSMLGGGSTNVYVDAPNFVGSRDELARVVTRAIQDAVKTGSVRRGALV